LSKKEGPKLSSVVMGNLIFNVLAIAAGVVILALFLYAITRSVLAAIHGLHRQ
jgi:HAMP domain-containing protein